MATQLLHRIIWLFPKIRGPILVAPIIRTLIYLGLFGAPYSWKPPYGTVKFEPDILPELI